MTKKLNDNITYCILTFILYAFLGWVYEVILEFYYGNGFINRGFLFGPYLPVYGFGALLILFLLYKFSKKRIPLGRMSITPILVFILIFIISTIVEYSTGIMLDTFLGKRLWDYSNYAFNINGLVCLNTSTRFAIGGTLFIYWIQPIFDKMVNSMNTKFKNLFAYSILVIVATDFILKVF
jgi:uncharacterized membrane protein